jgi:hypothetical protein
LNLDGQIGGTANIEAKGREGIDHLRELDAIFTQLYRKSPVVRAIRRRWGARAKWKRYPTA